MKLRKVGYVQIVLLLLMMCVPKNSAAASDQITLLLSKDTAVVEGKVTVSGVTDPSIWVPIKMIDEEQSIALFDTAKSDGNGYYSMDIIVPKGSVGKVTIIVGSGRDTTSKTLNISANSDNGGSDNGGSNNGGSNSDSGSVEVDPTPDALIPVRLAGYDRFETAIAIAEQGWPNGSDTVVLTYAYDFPDALAAVPLAKKYNAPILLTDNAMLTSSTLAEIKKLTVKKIILIGGTSVISQGIEDSLRATYGQENVLRYGGEDRYATAAVIAGALGSTGKAVIANGENGHYQDALAVSPYAAAKGIPILFTQAEKLPEATAQALAAQKVDTTIVVGGEVVVSPTVYNQLAGATRYGGVDCYATATAIAEGLRLNLNRVYVVTGLNFPDALVAGNLAAHTLSPLIMVDQGLPEATEMFLTANKATVLELTIVGGEGVISLSQDKTLRNALK